MKECARAQADEAGGQASRLGAESGLSERGRSERGGRKGERKEEGEG